MIARVLVAAALLAGCYSPPAGTCVQCAASEACPEGLVCFEGHCVPPGSETPCGADDAAPPDATETPAMLSGLGLGWEHSCGIDADDALWCWGLNYTGQIGAPIAVDTPVYASAYPVTAAGATGWREVGGGAQFTCAIAEPDGEIYCWGFDSHGQLGRDSEDFPFGPPQLVVDDALPGTGWDDLAVGHAHVCALRAGGLYCWGSNEQQQLGIGANPNQDLPVAIGGETDWVAVVAEGGNTCALRGAGTDRHLYCWGLPNALGTDPVGGGPYGYADREIEHPNRDVGRRFQSVSLGSGFACAIDDQQDLLCWGYNDLLQQGDPGGGLEPSLIDSLHDWTAIRANGQHACGITAEDELFCWGASHFGQSGVRADLVELDQPIAGSWREVAVARWHTCAVSTAGEASCWGDNGSAQLGFGEIGDGYVPRQVAPGTQWTKVVAGWHSTCAIAETDGSIWCWGLDEEGVLGTPGDTATPWRIDSLGIDFIELALHLEHGCAIQTGGGLWCWGDGDDGELGTGTDHGPDPTQVGTASWRSVGLTDRATCGIRDNGTLWCWGSRYQGMLGDGLELGIEETPIQITSTLGEWDRLAAGPSHVCAFRQADGSAACWGWNEYHAVDEATTEVIATPDPISAPATGWTALSTGGEYYSHTCGLVDDSAYCWGSPVGGRLGLGDFTKRTSPTELTMPSADLWESISAGGPHTCGLRDGGKLFCWGDELVLPLGNGRVDGSEWPVQVGVAAGWKQVDGGTYHVCAIDAADALWCWGDGSQLQLGSGVGLSAAPRPVTAIPAR